MEGIQDAQSNLKKRLFWSLFALTLVVMAGLLWIGAPLKNEAAPDGILSFEFAGTVEAATRILTAWGPEGRVHAGLSLGLDYLFLVLYPLSIGLACLLVAEGLKRRWAGLAKAGRVLAWAQPVAGLLDAIENFALIKLLLGSTAPLWPTLAWWTALPKFLIVAAGLLYVLVGLVLRLLSRR